MPPTFTRLFAERVNKLTTFDVREGRDGEMLEPGTVYIAPGGLQTEIRRIPEGLQLRVFPAGNNDLYAPSVDRMINSASVACGDRLIAVIMTGMGDDGAEAIRGVRERGGRTIAESSESAIIFGMPAEAIRPAPSTNAALARSPARSAASAVDENFCRTAKHVPCATFTHLTGPQ